MTPPRRIALDRRIVVIGLIMAIGGCAPSSPVSPTPASPTSVAVPPSAAPSAASASPSPAAISSATASPTPDASCADRTLAGMTEAQRIGQVFMIGLEKDALNAAERAAVADFHVGSFAFTTQSRAGVKTIRALTDSVQALATQTSTAGVPFFVAANQEGGQIQGLAGPGFDVIPSALATGVLWLGLAIASPAYFGPMIVDDTVTFGTIGAVLTFLTWFVLIAGVIVLGAALGAVWLNRRDLVIE